MRTTATHNAHPTTPERVLCMAFALSEKSWQLGCTTGHGQKPRERGVAARHQARVLHEIAPAKKRFALPATAPVVSCDASGRDGFWLHRLLQAHGITTQVVDSAAIAVKRRQRRAQSDGLDVRKWLSMLLRYAHGAREGWRVVHVPTVDAEDGRHLHRDLETLQQERASTTTRSKGLLSSQGVQLKNLSQLPAHLDALRLWDGSELPSGLRRRVLRGWAHHECLSEQSAAWEAARRAWLETSQAAAIEQGRQVMPLRGLGIHGAWVLVLEFFAWRAFKHRREAGGFAGGTPTPYHRGASARDQGIPKSGTRHVRWMTTELAWSGGRDQPESARSGWFRERCGGGGKRLRRSGSVAVARKFLIALWRCLKSGVFPAGAVLTEAEAVLRCGVRPRTWCWWRRPVVLPGP
jgi:transposase